MMAGRRAPMPRKGTFLQSRAPFTVLHPFFLLSWKREKISRIRLESGMRNAIIETSTEGHVLSSLLRLGFVLLNPLYAGPFGAIFFLFKKEDGGLPEFMRCFLSFLFRKDFFFLFPLFIFFSCKEKIRIMLDSDGMDAIIEASGKGQVIACFGFVLLSS